MPAADYRAYPVLCVDDEESNLVVMRYSLEPFFDVETSAQPAEAAKLLSSRKFAVLLTDQRMPEMSGVELCAHSRAVSPETVRIIVTGYADLHATIDAVNRGAVMRYLQKPLRDGELAEVVRSAINVIHAKRAINALEHQMLQGGTKQAFRALEARFARDLAAPVGELKSGVAHLQDLTVGLRDAADNKPMLEEMTRTLAELVGNVRTLEDMAAKLGRSAAPQTPRADAHRVVRSILTLSGRDPGDEREPLMLSVEPATLAQALGAVYRRALQVARDPEHVEIQCLADGRHVVFVVADDGPELAADDLSALFDARLDPLPGDDGRSMALAAELVREAGGSASVRCDAGSTHVEFRIPMDAA